MLKHVGICDLVVVDKDDAGREVSRGQGDVHYDRLAPEPREAANPWRGIGPRMLAINL